MPAGRAIQLSGFWTDWSIMKLDKGIHGVGAEDGHLSLDELSFELLDLSKKRENRELAGKPTYFLDNKLDDGRKLYKDMTDHGLTRLKYLPDDLLELASGARARACEILRVDDITATGEIDQFCIDHARARYKEMNPASAVGLAAKSTALEQIGQIALALGLS